MTSFAIVTVCVSLAASSSSADSSAAIGEGRQPRLTTNGGEAVYCVYGAGEDIFCVRSTDGGASFSQPAKVATLRGLMLGKRRGPRVAATGDVVVVSAISSETGDLVAWRSVDGAKTWSDAVRINDIDCACREGLHDMAPTADGSIAAVWLDLRNRETQLWASLSRDGGTSWESNRLVYRSPDGSICECCHPTVVATENTWSVLWRNNIEGHRDTLRGDLKGFFADLQ